MSEENLCALASSHPEGKFAAAIRDIWTNITVMRPSGQVGNGTLALISWKRAAGCTLIAANLAHVMRETVGKVTLVDTDIRHSGGGLTDRIGSAAVKAPTALADALTNDACAGEATSIDVDGIALLPSRSTSPRKNYLALLSSPKMAQIIEGARSRSEVILDLPPLCAGADAVAIAQYADAVLLVAVAGNTTRDELTSAVRDLRSVGVNVIGAILNRASK
jgi:Mrp family chromosome partitioning ATPase